ncbi:MAG: LysR substrate-binding domain-containing protein [Pyrinomonadaceae bacterium]
MCPRPTESVSCRRLRSCARRSTSLWSCRRLEAIKKFVERGLGVALVPRLTALDEIARGQVIALTVREMRLERRLHIVYRKGTRLSHAARAFLKTAQSLLEAKQSGE